MKLSPETLINALEGKLAEDDVVRLTSELRQLSPASVSAVARQADITITGDGNVIGSGNVVNVHKTEVSAELARALREALRSLYQLRAPLNDFVGREKEIEALIRALRTGGSASISGISGMGGIGKTELALLVANRVRDDYPDAQLFVDMRGTDDPPRAPTDALTRCIRAFAGLEAMLPEDVDYLSRLYLSNLSGKRILVLLDNAADMNQIRPLLPPEGCGLLVTSRNTMALPGTRLTIEELEPDKARELLVSIAPHTPDHIADQICFLCGYLPLAIRAAGNLLAVTADLDPTDYAAQLRDERTRLERIGARDVPVGVEASFNLSYARLEEKAQLVFRQLAVFPASFDVKSEVAVSEDSGHAHLSELVRRSMVLYDKAAKRYRLHDLVRLFADSLLSEPERNAARLRHASHYLALLRTANKLYVQGGEALKQGLALFDLEWINIEAGQAWAEANAGKDKEADELCNLYPDAGTNLIDLRLHPHKRIGWCEAGLAAARRLKRRSSETVHLGHLGNAYWSLGEVRRAIEFYEQRLTIAKEIGDRQGEGIVLWNMSLALEALGDRAQAIGYAEDSLKIREEIEDPLAAKVREQLAEWKKQK